MNKDNPSSNYIYFISLVAAIGGFLFGYDTAVIAGAIGFLEAKFNLTPVMTGWAASSAIWGCVIGAFFAGSLSDRLGRKNVLFITAVLFAISAITSAIPQNLTQFIFARMIGGIGVGAASMLAPLYISEVAPADKRGKLVSMYQLAIVIGINIVYFINLLIARSGTEEWNIDMGWRYMLLSELIPAIAFFIMLFFVPESPRWLVSNGRMVEASDILRKVNGTDKASELLDDIILSTRQEIGTLRDLLSPNLRKALMIGVVLALFCQITGINAIIYYAPEIFKSVGFGTDSAMTQTVIIGLTNTIFTFVAIKYIDKLGRRKLLLWGIAGMMICLFGVGTVFYLSIANGPILLLFIIGFIACFAMSLGPIPWVIMAEIFPNKIRGIAMSLSTFVLWIGVVLITQLTPVLLDSVGGAITFWIFGLNALILFIFTYRNIPETKGKTLEEIEKSWFGK